MPFSPATLCAKDQLAHFLLLTLFPTLLRLLGFDRDTTQEQSANLPCLWDLLTQGCTDAGGKEGNKLEQQQQKPSPGKVRFITVLLLDSLTLSALMAPFSKTIHTEESAETATSVAFA